MLSSAELVKNLAKAAAAMQCICDSDKVFCSVATAASHDEIAAVEREIGCRIPAGMREFFMSCGKEVLFRWYLTWEQTTKLPEDLRDVRSGRLSLCLHDLAELKEAWERWKDEVARRPIISPNGRDVYRHHEIFPFMQSDDRDILAIAKPGIEDSVVFVSGCLGEFHGVRLGHSFQAFLATWSSLCFATLDSFSLEAFYSHDADVLSLEVPGARRWMNVIRGSHPT